MSLKLRHNLIRSLFVIGVSLTVLLGFLNSTSAWESQTVDIMTALEGGGASGEFKYFDSGNSSFIVSGTSGAGTRAEGTGVGFYSRGNGTYDTLVISPSYNSSSDFSSSCSGGSIVSDCGGGSSYSPSCPSGYTLHNSTCCPNQYYSQQDTNGSAKGGVVGSCNIPPPTGVPTNPDGTPINPSTSSCTVNGTTVPHGGSYTFYTQGNVPYGSMCSSVAYDRVCNNGVFDGSDSGFSRCVVDDAPQIAPITIRAIPPIVRYGGSATIEWEGANAEACTVTGYGLTNVTGVTGNEDVANVIGESTYTLTCTLGPNTRSASTTLKVLPRTQET